MSSSTTKKQKPSPTNIPDNITVSTAFLAPIDRMVVELFSDIFKDYTTRFGVNPSQNPIHVAIAGTEGGSPKEPHRVGMTTIAEGEHRILVEVRDPTLSTDSEVAHLYVAVKFVEVLCHELVHVMQTICKRKFADEYDMNHNKADPDEKYFFDPFELEARVMESFYAVCFGKHLINASMQESE